MLIHANSKVMTVKLPYEILHVWSNVPTRSTSSLARLLTRCACFVMVRYSCYHCGGLRLQITRRCLCQLVSRDHSNEYGAATAAIVFLVVGIDIAVVVAAHPSLERVSEPKHLALVIDLWFFFVWQSRPKREGCVSVGPCLACTVHVG